jgi:hypothetical protein
MKKNAKLVSTIIEMNQIAANAKIHFMRKIIHVQVNFLFIFIK